MCASLSKEKVIAGYVAVVLFNLTINSTRNNITAMGRQLAVKYAATADELYTKRKIIVLSLEICIGYYW